MDFSTSRTEGCPKYDNGDLGGFHLVDLIITENKDHMTRYNFECSNWWKKFL